MPRPRKLSGDVIRMDFFLPAKLYASIVLEAKRTHQTVPDLVRETLNVVFGDNVNLTPIVEGEPIQIHAKPISGESMATIVPRILPRKARCPGKTTESREEYTTRYNRWVVNPVGPAPIYIERTPDGKVHETVGPLVSDFSPENPARAAAKKILDDALGEDKPNPAIHLRCSICQGVVYHTPSGWICDKCGGWTEELM